MSKINSGEQFLELYKEFFEKEAQKSMYGAVFKFGNINFKRTILSDVDIYSSPNNNIHPVDFYKEHHRFMESLKNKLQTDYNSDLIPFPTAIYKPEVVKLSNRVLDDVLFHNLVFLNVQDMFDKSKIITNKILQSKALEVIQGNPNEISNVKNLDFLFNFYSFVAKDTTLSNYDAEMNSLKVIDQFNYVAKHLANEKPMKLIKLNDVDAKKLMFEGLDIIKEYFPLHKLAA